MGIQNRNNRADELQRLESTPFAATFQHRTTSLVEVVVLARNKLIVGIPTEFFLGPFSVSVPWGGIHHLTLIC